MPFIGAAIGAIVGAVASVGAAITAVGVGLGLSLGAATAITGLIGTLALTAGLSLVGKLLRGSTDPPPARGSVTQTILDPNAPQPYVMGEGLAGGAVRYDVAYGPTLKDVPNPYRWMPIVYSGGGPIWAITPYVDQAPIDTSYYGGFLDASVHAGACPQTAAMTPALYGPAPGWDSTSINSGQAMIGWNFKFDRDGKVFAGGIPQLGAYGKWVKVYDPRLDSTFPGGSGGQRITNEATWGWSENPALHAGTYAYGRYQNGKRTIGCGLPYDAINWSNIAAWANVCDANAWTMFGIVYEPDDRWQNLKDIAIAGGGMPLIAGGVLSFHYQAPRVSLETITEADLADDDMSVTAMRSYRDRINTISPKYTSPDHNWEKVNADPVSVSTYITDDGGIKQVEWPFNFVKDAGQAAQLARYVIEDSREFQPIEITCLPTMRALRPGDCVDLYLPSLGLDTSAVIISREIDPGTMKVKFTLVGETPGKHAFALGQTGTPPAAPALGMTGAARDLITWGADRVAADAGATRNDDGENFVINPQLTDDTTGWVLSAGVFRQSISGFPIGAWFQFPVGSSLAAIANGNGFIPTNGATKLHVSSYRYVGGVATDFRAYVNFFTEAGVYVSSDNIDLYAGGTAAFTLVKGVVSVPANATQYTVNYSATFTSGVGNAGALRVASVESGADVTVTAQVLVSVPTEVVITTNGSGAALTGQLPRTVDPTVTKGGADIRLLDGTTYALSNVSASLTSIAVDNTNGSSTKGRVTLTTMSGSGSANLTVTANSVAQPPIQIVFSCAVGSGSTSSSTGGTVAGNGVTVNSTSYIEIGRVTGVVKSTSQTISANLSTSYDGGFDGTSRTVTAKWQYSPAGTNSWTDMGGGVTGSGASFWFNPYSGASGSTVGAVTCNQTAAPSNGSYDVRLVALTNSTYVLSSTTYGPFLGWDFSGVVSVV